MLKLTVSKILLFIILLGGVVLLAVVLFLGFAGLEPNPRVITQVKHY